MASVNKVILIGNLGQDPEKRYTGSGAAVTSFSLATTNRWKDKSGQNQEQTEWHRVVVWGQQAESCAQYLAKGRPVYVEGRLQTRQWDDKSGNKRYTTEVVAQRVQFLGSPTGGKNTSDSKDSNATPPMDDNPGFPMDENDDVPF